MTTNILMVCLGNICRSPLAEGILASKLPQKDFFIDSAGTGNWHIGKKPDPRSIAVAKKNNITISNQKCRQFSVQDFDTFDYIYAMDHENYQAILALAKTDEHKNKVDYILNALFENENVDVPDPFYGHEQGFENVYQLLNEACDIIAKNLKQKQP